MDSKPKYGNAREVANYFGVNRSTIWRWTKKGFPKPVKLPCGSTKWRWSHITAWEESA